MVWHRTLRDKSSQSGPWRENHITVPVRQRVNDCHVASVPSGSQEPIQPWQDVSRPLYSGCEQNTVACERTWSEFSSWTLHSVLAKKQNRRSTTSSRTVPSGGNRDSYGRRMTQPRTSFRERWKTCAAPPNSWQHVDWGSKHSRSTAEEEEFNPFWTCFPQLTQLCGLCCLEETTAKLVYCDSLLQTTAVTIHFLLLTGQKKLCLTTVKRWQLLKNIWNWNKDYRMSSLLSVLSKEWSRMS